MAGPHARRLIVVGQSVTRKQAPGKNLSLFADDPDMQGWRYGAFVTTLDLPAVEIWRAYRGRTDGENRIKELKADFGFRARRLQPPGLLGYRSRPGLCHAGLQPHEPASGRPCCVHGSSIPPRRSMACCWPSTVPGPGTKQQRLLLSVPRRKHAWFAGLWANAADPPVIPKLAEG